MSKDLNKDVLKVQAFASTVESWIKKLIFEDNVMPQIILGFLEQTLYNINRTCEEHKLILASNNYPILKEGCEKLTDAKGTAQGLDVARPRNEVRSDAFPSASSVGSQKPKQKKEGGRANGY